MMQVPFEKLGPGQSGRLVYQVMGENGPVFNPGRIRYLSPDQVPNLGDQPLNLQSAFAPLAAMNLAASVGSVALSAAVLREGQQLHEKVDRALFTLDRVEAKVDRLIQQIERIDVRVAENNLRHALDHIIRRSVCNDEIDLHVISQIKKDIELFSESLDDGFGPCNSFGLCLSSDVEDKLDSIYKLLFSVRHFVYTQHNLLAKGDPFRTISINRVEDYLPNSMSNPVLAAAGRKALDTMWEAQEELGRKVYGDFTFADEAKANEYQDWLGEAVISPVVASIAEGNSGAVGLALDWETDISDMDQAVEYYSELRSYWLWHTSAGLLWRTYVETIGIIDGYNEAWDLGRERIEQLEESRLFLSTPVGQADLESMIAQID